MKRPYLLEPEFPGGNPESAEPALQPVPERTERPEPARMHFTREPLHVLEQERCTQGPSVECPVAIAAGEEEVQLASAERLPSEPLDLGRDIGAHCVVATRGLRRLVAGDVSIHVAMDAMEEVESHLLLETSDELPEPFAELGSALVLQEPGVEPRHGKAPDVVERGGDERRDILLSERAPERDPLGKRGLPHARLPASPVLR